MANQRNRRIAFLGGKPLSARCLRRLFEYQQRGETEIVAVLGRPRGESGWWSAPGVPEVADTASALGLNLIEHEESLAEYEVDLVLSVLYYRILSPRLLAHPRNGCLNLHLAPLPHYRGCNSSSHAILNGETRFGATLHYMDEKVDHGDIVEVKWFDMPETATARQLMNQAEEAAFELFAENLPSLLANQLQRVSQDEVIRRDKVTPHYYPRNSLSAAGMKQVNLDWPTENILRHVRAYEFPPFEPAYTVVDGRKEYLTFESAKVKTNKHATRVSPPRIDDVPQIPLLDLKAQHESIQDELRQAVEQVVSSCGFIGGPEVDGFAAEFAAYCGTKYCIPCSNGTEALRLAIVGVLGEGDGEQEIITVSHTFSATVEAIVAARYRPVLVDVDPATYLINLDEVEAVCTKRTVAVVPVHLYGQMLDVPRLARWARQRGVAVIEDAAQAQGARFGEFAPGQAGDAATFSFYPGKNIGAWGDAGAVVCNDEAVASRIEQYVDHGRSDKFTHVRIGVNSRMDALQAAVLRVKLRHLDAWNEGRRRVAGWYHECLAAQRATGTNVDCRLSIVEGPNRQSTIGNRQFSIAGPAVSPSARHVYHQYVVQVDDRSGVRQAMSSAGISTGIHYPIPVHEQPAYRFLGYAPNDLPVTHRICKRILSLPMFPELSRRDVERIVVALHEASLTALLL